VEATKMRQRHGELAVVASVDEDANRAFILDAPVEIRVDAAVVAEDQQVSLPSVCDRILRIQHLGGSRVVGLRGRPQFNSGNRIKTLDERRGGVVVADGRDVQNPERRQVLSQRREL
jgi:hypothetical protein